MIDGLARVNAVRANDVQKNGFSTGAQGSAAVQ
jgi:hypothetical protein